MNVVVSAKLTKLQDLWKTKTSIKVRVPYYIIKSRFLPKGSREERGRLRLLDAVHENHNASASTILSSRRHLLLSCQAEPRDVLRGPAYRDGTLWRIRKKICPSPTGISSTTRAIQAHEKSLW